MTKNLKTFLTTGPRYIVGLVILALIIGCGSGSKESEKAAKEDENTMYEGREPLFYTEANPGKWHNQKTGHVPVVEFKRKDNVAFLSAKVPLEQQYNHYIEALVLLNYKREEVAKISYRRGSAGFAQAEFFLGSGKISQTWYVVAKCNKHDMWEKKLILDSSQFESSK